jgi:hypothetical protein
MQSKPRGPAFASPWLGAMVTSTSAGMAMSCRGGLRLFISRTQGYYHPPQDHSQDACLAPEFRDAKGNEHYGVLYRRSPQKEICRSVFTNARYLDISNLIPDHSYPICMARNMAPSMITRASTTSATLTYHASPLTGTSSEIASVPQRIWPRRSIHR